MRRFDKVRKGKTKLEIIDKYHCNVKMFIDPLERYSPDKDKLFCIKREIIKKLFQVMQCMALKQQESYFLNNVHPIQGPRLI